MKKFDHEQFHFYAKEKFIKCTGNEVSTVVYYYLLLYIKT